MTEYHQVKFRTGAGSDFEKKLATRSPAQNDRAYSQVAREDLEDYYELLELCLPEFTRREREILRQALNGYLAEPEKIQHLWLEVEAISDDNDFIARIRNLSAFECWCIANAFKMGNL